MVKNRDRPRHQCVDENLLARATFLILKGVFRMGQAVLDKIAEVKADFSDKLAAAQGKIDEDFAEVKRQLAEAIASGNDTAPAQSQLHRLR